ncbi:Bicoid-interacting protein 3-domain-containing protein [Lophiotrema nucula]|uniref:RNA methyltransferase n=1 Tax=Lophiotrema nucula TaxID=690887 RepID=A0A6A5YJG4_9PLEO|nr:Bicoid-interacting protein 3-domain-containing protein [Lophiotrema nucula]
MATNWGNYRDYNGAARHIPGSSPSVHVRDARLTLLDRLVPGLFEAKACLDIGCNAGAVSCQLAFDFRAASVTGVDIDIERIKQAQNLLQLRSSRVRPTTEDFTHEVDYFPISAVLEHGYRFEELKLAGGNRQREEMAAPASSMVTRVKFVSEDWTAIPAASDSFDVILALSVVKWIHLEHCDGGLVLFFAKCSSSLVTGGYLVLEVQPWSSYEKAVQKAPHFSKSFGTLTFRPETSFTDLLKQQGFDLCITSEALPRRILVYRKC